MPSNNKDNPNKGGKKNDPTPDTSNYQSPDIDDSLTDYVTGTGPYTLMTGAEGEAELFVLGDNSSQFYDDGTPDPVFGSIIPGFYEPNPTLTTWTLTSDTDEVVIRGFTKGEDLIQVKDGDYLFAFDGANSYLWVVTEEKITGGGPPVTISSPEFLAVIEGTHLNESDFIAV